MPITPLPTPPSRSMSSDAFVAAADLFLGALPTFQTEANALEANVNGKEGTTTASAASAATSASSASNSAIQASTSAAAASLYGTAVLWVSGTTYAVGNVVVAPANKLLYKRKVAGSGTTDPSLDATNWDSVGLTGGASSIKLSAILATFPEITIVDHCLHHERDDSPRARGWRRRKGQTWRSEARSLGRPLGSYATATAAVTAGAALTDFYYNTTNSRFEEITNVGTPASTATYRAGKEDYPTNALVLTSATAIFIMDLDGAVPSMWGTYALSLITCIYAVDSTIIIGRSAGGMTQLNFVADALTVRTATAHLLVGEKLGTSAVHTNTWVTSSYLSTNYLVNATVNDVAITVLPDAPIDENEMPVLTRAVATAGGVSVIKQDGAVVSRGYTSNSATSVGFALDRVVVGSIANTSKYSADYPLSTLTTGTTATIDAADAQRSALYSPTSIPALLLGNSISSPGNLYASTGLRAYGGSSGLMLLKSNFASQSGGAVANITSTYNTGYMVGDIRRAIGYDSASALADKSVKASAGIAEVGTLTKTPVSGGRTAVSGFSSANYIQEVSHADWNARGTANFYDILSGGKWGTVATLKTIVSIGDGASNGSLKIEHLVANTLRLSIYNAGWTTIGTSTAAFTDTAEHTIGYGRMTLAGVADTCFIAVDGVIVASAVSALTISNATGYLRIGEGQDASQPWAGGQYSGYFRVSATAPTTEGSKFIAAQENALNSGHACLLSNSSSVSQLDYYSRSNMLAVGNGTNTDFFVGLAREGVITTSTGATVSGNLPSEATIFHTGTTNTLRVGERNVEAELTEQIPSIPKTLYYSFTSSGTTQALPQGWKARGVAFNLTDGTMLAVAQTFDGFVWTQTGLTTAKAYQVELEEVL